MYALALADFPLIRFYTAAHLQEAQLLVQMLAGKRIESIVANSNASGALGELPVTLPEIWLLDDRDVDLARGVIDEYENSAQRADENQSCPACNEVNPGSFDLCWQCGSEFD